MRRALVVIVLLSLAAVEPAASAARATTSSCRHLITDRRGDAYSWFLPTRPYNPDADLLYVDAVTTPTTIDFTVTMARVDPKPTTGTNVTVYFTINTQGATFDYSVTAAHEIDGTTFSLQNED